VKHPFEHVVRLSPRYLLDQLNADIQGTGHNVRATIYVECGAMYRSDGPVELRPVGETEFVNGVAAMSASGLYGEARACAGIVGHADLRAGSYVAAVLEAHIAAGNGRFRGIRQSASWDADPTVLGPLAHTEPHRFMSADFRKGFAELSKHGLSFDAWLLEPQLDELLDLAKAFPDTRIVLDHVGTPLGVGGYAGRRDERFEAWADNIRKLAALPNMHVKLGGLAMAFAGFDSYMAAPPASSEVLAAEWKPYIETCIEAFGADRCMFESNFPVDLCGSPYGILWNAFKRITAGYSASEKTALFSGTACKFYRISI
jgi:predicted TIM-barrel fold metal-dependent hydrolase